MFLNGEPEISIVGQMVKIIDSHERIILRGEDSDPHGQLRQDIAGQGIAAEVIHVVSPLRVIRHNGFGQSHAGVVMKDVVKVIEVGEAMLLLPERSFPLGEKIMAIDGKAGVNGQSGSIGIQSRTDAEDFLQIGYRGNGLPEGDTESEVTAKGKSYKIAWSCRQETGDILHRMVGLFDQGAVKESPVQVMTFPMVPQVESKDVVPPPVKKTSGREDISGIGASFPAMQKNDQPFRLLHMLSGMITQQTHTRSGINDYLLRDIGHLVFSPDPHL